MSEYTDGFTSVLSDYSCSKDERAKTADAYARMEQAHQARIANLIALLPLVDTRSQLNIRQDLAAMLGHRWL